MFSRVTLAIVAIASIGCQKNNPEAYKETEHQKDIFISADELVGKWQILDDVSSPGSIGIEVEFTKGGEVITYDTDEKPVNAITPENKVLWIRTETNFGETLIATFSETIIGETISARLDTFGRTYILRIHDHTMSWHPIPELPLRDSEQLEKPHYRFTRTTPEQPAKNPSAH